MINVQLAAPAAYWAEYEAPLTRALKAAGVDADLSMDHAPEDVDYIVYAPHPEMQDFTPFKRCKAVLSLWAGVEKIVGNQTLTMPLTRMVDPGLKKGMVEFVTGHVLRYHLGMDQHILVQDGVWRHKAPPLAQDRKVTILGLGELGRGCAEMLVQLGFQVRGWARSPRELADIACFSGAAGMKAALEGAEIIVLLLPDTPETENVLDSEAMSWLAHGASILNPGRGPLIDDDALLAALDSGQVAHATLDVFRVEPLPAEHPFWAHPDVTVTPHIASETRADTASKVVAENIRRADAGEPLLYLVDRAAGY
ncbi:glyoxylate/hydroxypyruvate reductase A [Donghicola sp.]|jgi:glyoxylate/hydroxypyruvate reductase A|uniref:2-hydroxyacid dehydrogenase n=1 Tax=Donghicola sp. TaxID=1929294 RepID=UPI0025E7CEE5|nr:glyoxylate/hydroxypyruvate reductase A [Donghicola sp.]MCT4578508.1 glyoxylate/hydroxypyruvate reductase A [Donghicola sp.]